MRSNSLRCSRSMRAIHATAPTITLQVFPPSSPSKFALLASVRRPIAPAGGDAVERQLLVARTQTQSLRPGTSDAASRGRRAKHNRPADLGSHSAADCWPRNHCAVLVAIFGFRDIWIVGYFGPWDWIRHAQAPGSIIVSKSAMRVAATIESQSSMVVLPETYYGTDQQPAAAPSPSAKRRLHVDELMRGHLL
jgi:hypothetical protein